MANHLKSAAIQTLLGTTVGLLHPGDVEDLLSALDRIHVTEGPDHDRSMESTLGTIFPSGMNP